MSVDEIIARERKGAFGFTDDRRCLFTYGDFRRLLMEIEAAWMCDERHAIEHATHHAEAVARGNCRDCIYNPHGENYEGGNAAAMRDALEKCVDLILSFGNAELDETPLEVIIDIEAILKAALSALPRNCELYSNWYDAHQAWERLPKDELGYYVQENGVECCEIAWLFEPAKKGDQL